MSDHGSAGSHSGDFESHKATYDGFIKGSVALTFVSLFVLIALVSFSFVTSGNLLLGFGGLILGFIAVAIDARAGGKWLLSGGLLVLYALVVAVALS